MQSNEGSASDLAQLIPLLSEKNITVLALMADNLSDIEIATKLSITGKGVEWHKTVIYKTLGLVYPGSIRKRISRAIEAYKFYAESQVSASIDMDDPESVVDFKMLTHDAPDYIPEVKRLLACKYRLEKIVEFQQLFGDRRSVTRALFVLRKE